MQLKFYHDDQAFPHVEAKTPYEVLGWFLEQDVQSSIPWGRELVKMIENVQSGRDSYWEGTGNAHTLVLTRKGVRIDNEYVDPPQSCELSLDDFKRAVLAWLQFLQKPIRSRLDI